MLLRRADVIDGAMRLLDAEGLDGLSTRKLGASLNVQGPALYRHFRSKEALLDAMADRLLEGVTAPLPAGPWDEQLGAVAYRLREGLLSHRDGARVLSGTYVTGPNTRVLEGVIFEILERAGLPAEEAGWVALALGYYVMGHAIEEQAQARLVAEGGWPARLTELTGQAASGYSRTAVGAAFGADPADRFGYGLGLFLEGVRSRLRG
jgi:AcrR family transcriptional regulator